MTNNISIETARKILIDILKTLALPENSKKIQEAKCETNILKKYFVIFFESIINQIYLYLQLQVGKKPSSSSKMYCLLLLNYR